MERQFAEAAALGHDALRMVTRPHGNGVQGGTYAGCSCGWEATPRRRKVVAASAAYFHVLEVLELAAAGTLPATDPAGFSQPPKTPQLRHQGRMRSA